MGIFKNKTDIISEWGPRLFLEVTAEDVYGDSPVVRFYKHVTSVEADIALIKAYGKPDVQQSLLELSQQVMREHAYPLVTSKPTQHEEAVEAFAFALWRSTAYTITGELEREDPTGFELGLCIVIGEALYRLRPLKLRDKYGVILVEGLLSLAAWMLNYDNQQKEQ
jgi:hypothetical protein